VARRPPTLLWPARLGRRLVDLLGPTGGAARQSLGALAFNSSTSFIAGAVLGSITGTLEELPGLLVMIPAAIGLRGNIFGSLGNRISTAVHVGTFKVSFRRESVLGQNVAASIALTFALSLILAVIAKLVSTAFDVTGTISVLDMALISVAGGLLASVLVLLATIALSVVAVRRNWDLDNLVAPTMSTLGDVITVPALFLATYLLGHGAVSTGLAWALVLLSVTVFGVALRSRLEEFRRVIRESLPVLTAALLLSTLAGAAIQKQLDIFAALPALLVLQPAFVSSAGALGGILSSRCATGLHLGLVEPTLRPGAEVRRDTALVLALALPVFVFNGVGGHVVGTALGGASPGLGWMILASCVGGAFAMLFVVVIAYWGTVAAWRVDGDPDTYGIPIVTASVDFVGVVALITAVVALGIAN
jgi:mgtE-like transporter